MTRYFKRRIEPLLKKALEQFPVCLITGPRQAGKSTLLQNVLTQHQYVTLDDPLTRTMAIEDPELFLSTYPAPLIIDEIQYAPGLLSYLKMRVDAERRKYGQYVLTGSQTFQVMQGVSESLAGRIAIFHLYPFSWEEMMDIPEHVDIEKDNAVVQQMIHGFYPEFLVQPRMDPRLWFGSYLSTYIERDIRNVKAIEDLGRFQTFVQMLATRAGKILNMTEIGKECGISQPTVKDWISILEATYVIYLLKPYHKNHSKRLVKSPKLYFVDTGLLCYLLGIDIGERLLRSSEGGAIFENMVVMEALKRLSYRQDRAECFFYRTQNGLEVDLIIERGQEMEAYEMKFAKTLSRDMAQPLVQFQRDHSVKSAKVLSLQPKSYMLAENVAAEHWSKILI